jgi:hypothetical protein
LALEDQFVEDDSVRKEYDKDDHFVVWRRDCPPFSFRVSHDLYASYFVAIHPADGNNHPVWIARAKSNSREAKLCLDSIFSANIKIIASSRVVYRLRLQS